MSLGGEPRYTMVVNADSVRWSYYSRELRSFWQARGKSPTVQLIDWRDAIDRCGDVRDQLNDEPSVLRIGSPARGFDLIRGFLRAGQISLGQAPTEWEAGLPGWLARPGLVYRGFCHVLQGLSDSFAELVARSPDCYRHVDASQRCADIATMFDKNATSEVLEAAGLPCPEWFRAPLSRQALSEALIDRRWKTSYVKLAYGSCASGIVHLTFSGGEFSGVTTVTEIEGRFHNTRRVKRVRGDELNSLLDFLLTEGATVQREIPKTRVDGENFDVRIVVVRGEVAGAIFRASPHPMTNLHLGGARAEPSRCRRELTTRHWLDALDDSREAAALFHLPSIGVDIAFDRYTGRPYIIELNAFGDFFPNWTNDDGLTIHQVEIESTAKEYQMC